MWKPVIACEMLWNHRRSTYELIWHLSTASVTAFRPSVCESEQKRVYSHAITTDLYEERLSKQKYEACVFVTALHELLLSSDELCLIHNYTEYNQQWNVFSTFKPSKCTHTWSSEQPTLRRPGSSWGFGALLKGLTSVVDNSCRSRDSRPQPRVTTPTLYPLGLDSP